MTSLVPIAGVIVLILVARMNFSRVGRSGNRIGPMLALGLAFFLSVFALKGLVRQAGWVDGYSGEDRIKYMKEMMSL